MASTAASHVTACTVCHAIATRESVNVSQVMMAISVTDVSIHDVVKYYGYVLELKTVSLSFSSVDTGVFITKTILTSNDVDKGLMSTTARLSLKMIAQSTC